jgi:polyphosphate kinase 2 (PPK2 family)
MAKKKSAAKRKEGGRPVQEDQANCRTRNTSGMLKKLHVELVKLQQWVVHKGLKVCIVFEGRDGAGKGGTIKAITERVSPARVSRGRPARPHRAREDADVHPALPASPAGRGRDRHLRPELVQPRRRRSGHGLSAPRRRPTGSLKVVPQVEKAIVDSGVILLKYWLEVSPEEQTRRLKARIDDGRKLWKLSPMDLKSYSRWYDYSRARDAMFAATDTSWAPWYVAKSEDKKSVRLNIIMHLLGKHTVRRRAAREDQAARAPEGPGLSRPDYDYKFVPEKY